MALTPAQLNPYLSVLVAAVADDAPKKKLESNVMDDLERHVLGSDRTKTQRSTTTTTDAVRCVFLHYVHEPRATWTSSDIRDRLNHLVLVCRVRGHMVIYTSERAARSAIARNMGKEKAGKNGAKHAGLQHLRHVSAGTLNAAFVQGRARTLWLSAVHQRTSLKADAKVLSGSDLRDALDPLSDQTYAFTAARCDSDLLKTPLGVAPRKGSIWGTPNADWKEFVDRVRLIVKSIEDVAKPDNSPLPVLAVIQPDATGVEKAYELSFIPPELLADDPTADKDVIKELERWAYKAVFDVKAAKGAEATADLSLGGEHLATVTIRPDMTDTSNVRIEVVDVKESKKANADLVKQAVKNCANEDWLVIRYASGHVINTGALYAIRHRDVAFDNWAWADLSAYNVRSEKPSALTSAVIGTEDSLFCWVQSEWPMAGTPDSLKGGWLACDDGSMEIADFIHFDDSLPVPILTLIHVKASKKDDADRSLSVADYEVVVSQAVKNLRYLDRLFVADGLAAGLRKKIGKAVWKDRTATTRDAMIKALKACNQFRRKVVVVQPRVTKTALDAARTARKNALQSRILTPLDTRLVAAEAGARGLGAEFEVVASQ